MAAVYYVTEGEVQRGRTPKRLRGFKLSYTANSISLCNLTATGKGLAIPSRLLLWVGHGDPRKKLEVAELGLEHFPSIPKQDVGKGPVPSAHHTFLYKLNHWVIKKY